MRRLSLEEERRDDEARRLASREEKKKKKKEKEESEQLFEPSQCEPPYGFSTVWEADNQPETAPSTKTQTKGKGKAQDEGAWYSHAWPQREIDTNTEPSTSYSLYYMPSTSQSIMDYPSYTVSGPLQLSTDYYQSYPMPDGSQWAWYDPPGCSVPAASQPPTDYDYYSSAFPQGYSRGHPTAESSREKMPILCLYPECTARSFKRKADFERHYRNTHSAESNKDKYLCDYSGCPRSREPFHRKDHFLVHLRQYHREDIPKRGASSDMRSTKTTWWRCIRCFARVSVSENGYECPNCKTSQPKSEGKR